MPSEYTYYILKFAEKDYSMALDLNPDNAQIYFNRGILRFEKGEISNFCKDMNKALMLKDYNAEYYVNKYCGEKK